MNCYKQIQEIVGIDRVMHEQVLELEWHEPSLGIKTKNELKSIQNATFNIRVAAEGDRARNGWFGEYTLAFVL